MSQKMHFIYIVIILIFAGTTIWWVDHSYKHDHAAEHYIQHIKDYPYLDPALPFYEQKNLIVNVQELRDFFRNLSEENKDWADMSIYFEVLNTGASISLNNDLKIFPASLAKLPIAMVALKKVEKGEWHMDQKFTVEQSDIGGREIITDIGGSYTLEQLLEAMLSESDNTSWRMLVRNMNEEEVIEVGAAIGLDSAFISDDKISAKEYTRLLRTLHSSTFLNYEHSNFILSQITTRGDGDYLSAGIPENIPFAHKWGRNIEFNVYGDSGIVYAKDRIYMISIFIQAKNPDKDDENDTKAKEVMKAIGEKTYLFITK